MTPKRKTPKAAKVRPMYCPQCQTEMTQMYDIEGYYFCDECKIEVQMRAYEEADE